MKSIKKIIAAGAIGLIPFLASAKENNYNEIFKPYHKELEKKVEIKEYPWQERDEMYHFFEKLKIDGEEIKILKKGYYLKKLFEPSKLATDNINHLMDFYFIDDIPDIRFATSTEKIMLVYGNLSNVEPHFPKNQRQKRTSELIKDYLTDDFTDRLKGNLKIRRSEFSAFENRKDVFNKNDVEGPANGNLGLDFKFKKDIIAGESVSLRANIFKIKSPIKSLKMNVTFDDNLEEVIELLFYKKSLTKTEISQFLQIERELRELYFSEVIGKIPTEKKGWVFRSTFYDNNLSNSLGYKYKRYFGEFGFSKNNKSIDSFFLNIGKQKAAVKLRYSNSYNNDYGVELSRKIGEKVFFLDFDGPFESKNKELFIGMRAFW